MSNEEDVNCEETTCKEIIYKEEKNCWEKAAQYIIDDISENLTNFNDAVKFLGSSFILKYWVADKLYNIYKREGLDSLRETVQCHFSKKYTDKELFEDTIEGNIEQEDNVKE